MLIELPSGKEIEMRKMRLSDEDIITDTRNAKDGKNMDLLLMAVTDLTKEELDVMLMGDRVYALIEFRKISRGNFFYPRVTCPSCKTRYEEEIDLDSLKVQKLDREMIDENYQFDIKLPSGFVLKARLLQGKDNPSLNRIRKQHRDKMMSHLMMLRTVSINDGEVKKNIDFFRDLEVDCTDHFRNEYDEHDCGVETTTEGICPNCDMVYDLDIPFDANFFLQTRKIRKK